MAIPKQSAHSRCAFLFAALCLAGCSAYDPALLSDSASLTHPGSDGGMHDAGGTPSGNCKKGADMTVCERPNADAVCIDGDCTIVRCRDAFSDCDGKADNGCETTLDTVESCGACGASCDLNHALRNRCAPETSTGPCAVDHRCQAGDVKCVPDALANGCEPGFGDCDGLAGNGCEASLHTLSNCGACGKVCASAVAEATCDTGKCVLGGCAEGSGDCDGNGCKSLSDDPKNCGKCDNACSSDASMCAGGRCTSKTCKKGEADCDGKPANGCEADLTSAATCGTCGVSCGPYPNASAGCDDAQCVISGCAPGFADCDDMRDNGCETDVTQNASCGMCGVDCGHLPHVTSANCSMSACANIVCEAGWGDCDGKPETGCEQSLNTADHCETCTGTCNAAHGTASCDTGKCVLSTCENGFDDCNGKLDDGCEAPLDSNDTCGKCDNKCSNGTACKNGGCACAGGTCADGSECCGGACIDTSGSCVPWPCIPGTKRDSDNCGGCGMACAGYCCAGGL